MQKHPDEFWFVAAPCADPDFCSWEPALPCYTEADALDLLRAGNYVLYRAVPVRAVEVSITKKDI